MNTVYKVALKYNEVYQSIWLGFYKIQATNRVLKVKNNIPELVEKSKILTERVKCQGELLDEYTNKTKEEEILDTYIKRMSIEKEIENAKTYIRVMENSIARVNKYILNYELEKETTGINNDLPILAFNSLNTAKKWLDGIITEVSFRIDLLELAHLTNVDIKIALFECLSTKPKQITKLISIPLLGSFKKTAGMLKNKTLTGKFSSPLGTVGVDSLTPIKLVSEHEYIRR